MKATIIGAGIGGLTTAVALQKAGIDYEIFEAAPELKPVGAGIVMASNAMQVFQRLGIADQIMSAGFEIANALSVDQRFKVINSLAVKDKVTPKFGIGSYAIHRWALQRVLLEQLDSSKIKLNKRLNGLTQLNNSVSLVFDDGSQTYSDFVVGADGIRSTVRKFAIREIPLRYSGQTCWRGVATVQLPEPLQYNSYEIWGDKRGLRLGFTPINDTEVYYFTTFFAKANGMDEPTTKKLKLKKIYSTFGEMAVRLIEATPEHQIIRSDISDFVPIKKWWNDKVVLIGDAAHATTPNLGQGGCQAVEDAYVLAKMVQEKKSLEEAFHSYQSIRFKKATHVVNTSWKLGQLTNIQSGALRWVRNTAMRMIPESIAIKELDKILSLNY